MTRTGLQTRLLAAAVSTFRRHDAADLVDPVQDLALRSTDTVPTATSSIARMTSGGSRRSEAAVATGSAEFRDLSLDHRDP